MEIACGVCIDKLCVNEGKGRVILNPRKPAFSPARQIARNLNFKTVAFTKEKFVPVPIEKCEILENMT